MKTKIIMGALIGIIAISGANAYNQSDKEKCQANPDKVVWIESKGACIPINPCKSSKYEAYCDRTFADIEVTSTPFAIKLINILTGKNCSVRSASQPNIFDQDYVYCSFEGKDYIVYEFDDMSDRSNDIGASNPEVTRDSNGLFSGLCLAHGGTIVDHGHGGSIYMGCAGISKKCTSDRIDIFGSVKVRYQLESDGKTCQIGKEDYIYYKK